MRNARGWTLLRTRIPPPLKLRRARRQTENESLLVLASALRFGEKDYGPCLRLAGASFWCRWVP